MDKQNYGMLLDTISVTLDCLNASTCCVLPELGTVQQSIWSDKEIGQFKHQLKGLMAMIPEPAFFNC